MKKYLVAVILVAGTLAIIRLPSALPYQLQPAIAPSLLHSQQSSFYTTTVSVGDANLTEFLVNTDIQFPIGGSSSQWQASNSLILAAIVTFSLFVAAIVVGMRSTRGSML